MQNISLLSRLGTTNPWEPPPTPIKILYASLQSMDYGIVEKYINDHKNTAILHAASTKAKQEYPDAVAIVSYYDRSNMKIIHNPLHSSRAHPIPEGSQDNFYTEDQPGFGSYITNIIADIPSIKIVIRSSNPNLQYNKTEIRELKKLFDLKAFDEKIQKYKRLLIELIWEHRHIAILYDPPQEVKDSAQKGNNHNKVIAAISYYNPYRNRIANIILKYPYDFQNVESGMDGSIILPHTVTDPEFQNITHILSYIPDSYIPPSQRRDDKSHLFNPSLKGGKHRKRNTYKKRHARRRKTQYRRRR